MSDHNKTSSSDDSWQKLDMPYDEFDVLVNDIDEYELELIGQKYEIENLTAGAFSSPAFPVVGHILDRNLRFMVPLVCQWAGKLNKCSVNVWFFVDTGSPFTCLTMKSLKSILGANKEIYENGRFDITIQDQNSVIECQVSKAHFKEVNILGANAMRKLELSGIEGINWRKGIFRLSPQ